MISLVKESAEKYNEEIKKDILKELSGEPVTFSTFFNQGILAGFLLEAHNCSP